MMPATSHLPAPASSTSTGAGAALVSTEGRVLPLAAASVRAAAGGGIARVVLEHRFQNVHDVPLHVTYTLPLPADGSVSGFSFRLGSQRIVGEIDRREAARERFEEAILSGHGAALLEQDRSSLFTQELGNIPAGAEVVAEIVIDQRLRWLDDGAWEWRFPTTVAPRYLGAPGRVRDAERVSPPVAEGPIEPRLTLNLCIRDALAPNRVPESPSHALRAQAGSPPSEVCLRDGAGAPLDRDVVVRWAVATQGVQTAIETARAGSRARAGAADTSAADTSAADTSAADTAGAPDTHAASAYGLLTLVPPIASTASVGRDVVVLLDTSGSMGGEPLSQACRVVSAVIDTLGAGDQLEMIQFSSAPAHWKREPVAVTPAVKREALEWLASRHAGGGTEMRAGIEAALIARRDHTQRQVLVVTDGFIGFEEEVVAAIAARRSPSTRVHTVGVGSAVNRSLTSAAARAGRGTEHIVGLGEDAEPAARRIVAATAAPLVVDLELSGSAFSSHAGLPDLFAGRPALIAVALRPAGGDLVIRGRSASGPWQQTLAIAPVANGAGRAEIVALYGRERVEELEMRAASGENSDAAIERIGLGFGIATRLTSWVAVSEVPSVDPQSPVRRERMPHALPHGVSAGAVGLRASGGAIPVASMARSGGAMPFMTRARAPMPPAPSGARSPRKLASRAPAAKGSGFLGRLFDAGRGGPPKDGAAKERSAPRGGGAQEETGDAGELILRGHLVRRDAARLVIEIQIDDTLAWELPADVTIEWSDGTRSSLTVDATKSTHSATLHAGQRARLVLAASAAEATKTPRSLRLTFGERELSVEL